MSPHASELKQEQAKQINRLQKKWTKPLIEAGFTVIPTIILERQAALGLEPLDVNILLQIAKHWWEAENPPFPSKDSLAKCMGVTARTVQRRIAALEAAGFITRHTRRREDGGHKTNAYTFEGLIDKATPFATEKNETREKRKQEDVARRRRKRARLGLVDEEQS